MCFAGIAPVAVMFRCDADGTGVRMLSSGSVTENTPAILPDGRILYTRWEYVNRDAVSFHHLWTMNPDGTEQQVYFGNQTPGGVFIDAQPIPQTREVVFIDSGYHGDARTRRQGDGRFGVGRPERHRDGEVHHADGGGFRDPYPLSPGTFLVARGNEILLLDDAGKTTPLYTGPQMVHEPRLLKPRAANRSSRPRGFVREHRDAVRGRCLPGPEHAGRANAATSRNCSCSKTCPSRPITMAAARRRSPTAAPGRSSASSAPCRWRPTARPIFEVPPLRSIYLALLDANDRSVKQMRSFVTLQPGEQRGCIGCHETRTQRASIAAGPDRTAPARPSRIEPIAGVPEILDFPRDIQPILDRHCVTCHNAEKRAGGVVLTGDRGPTYSLGLLQPDAASADHGRRRLWMGGRAERRRPPRRQRCAQHDVQLRLAAHGQDRRPAP